MTNMQHFSEKGSTRRQTTRWLEAPTKALWTTSSADTATDKWTFLMETATKATGKTTSRMEKGCWFRTKETSMKGSGCMGIDTGQGSRLYTQDTSTMGSGLRTWSRGRPVKLTLIKALLKDNFKTTPNQATEYLNGPTVKFTKESFLTMWWTDKARWLILTKGCMRESLRTTCCMGKGSFSLQQKGIDTKGNM